MQLRKSTRLEILALVLVILFQSHWLNDIGSGDSDAAGILVSLIGTTMLVAGIVWRRFLAGKAILLLGLIFVILVSLADPFGIRADGSRAENIIQHLQAEFGPLLTLAVAATLVCALALLVLVLKGSSYWAKEGT